jgi:hypothetical protein
MRLLETMVLLFANDSRLLRPANGIQRTFDIVRYGRTVDDIDMLLGQIENGR